MVEMQEKNAYNEKDRKREAGKRMKELGENIWEVTPLDVKLPRRDREAHKGNFGRVAILGGAVGYTGAPVLAARGALRAGAGLVRVLVPDVIYPIVAAHLVGAMPSPLRSDVADMGTLMATDGVGAVTSGLAKGVLARGALRPAREQLEWADVALVGPGLTREKEPAEVCRRLTKELDRPLVLDADGINAISGHIDVLDSRRDRLTVLTPHRREFIRLGAELEGLDPVQAARRFAGEHGCVLVLKGHRTVTALPDSRCFVNTTGNPGMATGGSGDVLSGMIASLLGQGLPPERAVPWAVCLHGRAGDLAAQEKGEYGMTVGDLVEAVPYAIKEREEE